MEATIIDGIADRLYASSPADILFHYTSLSAMQSIVEHRCIWATDVRYFSDAAELMHFVHGLHVAIEQRTEPSQSDVLQQFRSWLSERLPQVAADTGPAHVGHMVFAVSFSAHGNLLSQWRAYCEPAKGVSLGFKPAAIAQTAVEQGFKLGKCIYDHRVQNELVNQVLDGVMSLATELGPNHLRNPSRPFHGAFDTIENALLRIGALFKHPAFRDEVEWRAVSPVPASDIDGNIRYRDGASMLVPYIPFRLATSDSAMPLSDVFIGPTPHTKLAVESVSGYLNSHKISSGVFYCDIPYRTW